MRLHQLKVLLAVADVGTVRAAARRLGVSPAAVTKSVRQLEDELHTRLLERTQHGVVATSAGKAFLAHARAAHEELRKAQEQLVNLRGSGAGLVSFGVGPTAMLVLMPEAVTRFRKACPSARIRIMEGSLPALLALVRDETLDFTIALRPPGGPPPRITFRPLFRQAYVIVARKGHPLVRARSLADLRSAEWLTFAPRGATSQALEQLFAAARLAPPTPAIECESFNGMVALLGRTELLTVLSRSLLAMPTARDTLREVLVDTPLPSFTQGIFMRADGPLTNAAAAMVKACTSVARMARDV